MQERDTPAGPTTEIHAISKALTEVSAGAMGAWLTLRSRKRRPTRLELHVLRLRLYEAVDLGIETAEKILRPGREGEQP